MLSGSPRPASKDSDNDQSSQLSVHIGLTCSKWRTARTDRKNCLGGVPVKVRATWNEVGLLLLLEWWYVTLVLKKSRWSASFLVLLFFVFAAACSRGLQEAGSRLLGRRG